MRNGLLQGIPEIHLFVPEERRQIGLVVSYWKSTIHNSARKIVVSQRWVYMCVSFSSARLVARKTSVTHFNKGFSIHDTVAQRSDGNDGEI